MPTFSDICHMEILLVAATASELQPFFERAKSELLSFPHQINTLITGVGTLAASSALEHRIRQNKPDFLIQLGIGGSLASEYKCGEAVFIGRDRLADLGVVENEKFKDLFDLHLADPDAFPYQQGFLTNPDIARFENSSWSVCTGISVNEISTNPARIETYRTKYGAQIESMEGAAFHQSALLHHIPFIQIRGISNMVGERNKKNWKIPEALNNAYELLDWTLKNVI